jgi:O-antigen ligase
VLTLAVLSGPWPRVGLIAVAILAGGAILIRRNNLRAWSMLGALALAPVLLLDDVWHSSQLSIVHRHPAEAGVGVVFLLAVLAACAWGLYRWPRLVAPLVMLTLPFRVPISTGANDTANLLVPLYFVIAAAALAWIVPTLWAYRSDADPKRRPPDRDEVHLFEKLLAAILLIYAVQALYSSDFEKALQNEVFFYVPFAILLTLLRSISWDRGLLARCLEVTTVMAVIFACIGFVEEWRKTLFWNPKLIDTNELHRYFTVNSVFFDPDIFGRYLALVMILVTAVLLYDRRPRFQVGACFVLAILWAAMIFTLSRSSLAALVVGLAVLAAFRWRSGPVLALAGALVLVGLVAIVVSPRTFGLNQGLNRASSGRANLISGGIHLFEHRPLQGYGSGSFSTEYTHYYPVAARSVSQSHNIPVTIASEQGLIGLAIYLAFVIAAIITLFRNARGSPVRVAIAAAFLALLLHTMLYADFLEDPVTWTLLGIGGALAIQDRSRDSAASGEPTRARVGV